MANVLWIIYVLDGLCDDRRRAELWFKRGGLLVMTDASPHTALHGVTPANQDNPEVLHEASDVNIRAILGFGAGLLVAAVLIHFMVWLLFLYFSGREATRDAAGYPLAAGQAARLPPEPRLQTTPREDLRALRAREEEILNSYGWVDKPTGVVRIPIEEAMKLTLQRGLPARAASGEAKK